MFHREKRMGLDILKIYKKSASVLLSPDKQMFLREEKGGFSLLFSKGYLTSRGWALEPDSDALAQVINK
jgi:hypothetical protein